MRPVASPLSERESAARTYARHLPITLASASGVVVRDVAGREYVDCLAGAGALALGHSHPVVVEAVRRALADEVPWTTLDLATPLKERFVDELLGLLPAGLRDDARIQFCSPSGADAVEAALKLCRVATGRAGTVAFGGGYHGMTAGALSLTASRPPAVGPLPGEVTRLPFPSFGGMSANECARAVSWALEDPGSGVGSPSCVVMEPVQGEGGVHPAPPSFASAVRALCSSREVPLVFDEVQTGLGRTGSVWGCDALGVEPDVMVLSKAIGGGLPLAVVVYRASLDVWEPGTHAGTFRGNVLGMAAGLATMRHVVAEELPARAASAGALLMDGLRSAASSRVLDVRGRGLMVGVQLEGGARDVQRAMLERGVLVEVGGAREDVLRFLPPLVIEPAHVSRVVDAFRAVV